MQYMKHKKLNVLLGRDTYCEIIRRTKQMMNSKLKLMAMSEGDENSMFLLLKLDL